MTIHVYRSIDDPESEAVTLLKEKFEADPNLISSENNIYIISSVQCYGHQTQDVDLVVFGNLKNYSTKVKCKIKNNENNDEFKDRDVRIKNFCISIEVKKHTVDGLFIENSNLIAKYHDGNKNVTMQCRKEMYSLRDYIKDHCSYYPFICNLIFLPNTQRNQMASEIINDMNILFSDFNISDFWNTFFKQAVSKYEKSEIIYESLNHSLFEREIVNYQKLLYSRIEATRLDREKVERICKKLLRDQNYVNKLGEQMLIFRGRGGTGKTYKLLNLAHDIYEQKAERVLILTYNNALVYDIKRLLVIMKIRDGIGESIQIKSLHSFFYSVFNRLKEIVGKVPNFKSLFIMS